MNVVLRNRPEVVAIKSFINSQNSKSTCNGCASFLILPIRFQSALVEAPLPLIIQSSFCGYSTLSFSAENARKGIPEKQMPKIVLNVGNYKSRRVKVVVVNFVVFLYWESQIASAFNILELHMHWMYWLDIVPICADHVETAVILNKMKFQSLE